MSEHKSAHEVLGDAKKALDFLKERKGAAWPSVEGDNALAYLNRAMVELEAGQVRLGHMAERLEQQERSQSLYRTARDSDHAEASREITRLRQANQQLNEQVRLLATIPESDHGSVLVEAAEVCDWLETLSRPASNISNVGRGNFTTAAGAVRRLLILAKTLVENQPEAINLNEMRGELAELAGNTPGNAEVVDGLVSTLGMVLKMLDREQRARLRKEVGR